MINILEVKAGVAYGEITPKADRWGNMEADDMLGYFVTHGQS